MHGLVNNGNVMTFRGRELLHYIARGFERDQNRQSYQNRATNQHTRSKRLQKTVFVH